MLRVAICDDDYEQLYRTRDETARCLDPLNTEIDVFSAGGELLAMVEKAEYEPNIAILDIHMPQPDGIVVAKRLNEFCPHCRIIFITTYLGYATEVYETRHSYFVLKSQLSERLREAIGKVLADLDKETLISFRADGEQWKLGVEGVYYLERTLRKIKIVCRRRSFITTSKLEEILQEVPEGRFIHCHQSYWVNPAYIRTMTADSFVMADETVIPISRGSRSEAREAFFFYIHNHRD